MLLEDIQDLIDSIFIVVTNCIAEFYLVIDSLFYPTVASNHLSHSPSLTNDKPNCFKKSIHKFVHWVKLNIKAIPDTVVQNAIYDIFKLLFLAAVTYFLNK